MPPHYVGHAPTEAEAIARAKVAESNDPLPSVPCSLLSSGEIDDYVLNTGMIYPYDEANLKSASYEMFLGGKVIYWDEEGEKVEREVHRKNNRYLVLPANSITFVQVEPTFRLPNYIAIRFNLRITHVHRGLLLGTGPLVDPGFHGRLLIPLHNLTASEYRLDMQKALIWVEFTKTTFKPTPPNKFKQFPPENRGLTPDEYLFKANGGNQIVSSIPSILAQSLEAAKRAQTVAETIETRVYGWGIVAIIGLVLGVATLLFSAYSVMQNGNALSVSASSIVKDQGNASEKLDWTKKELERMAPELQAATRKLDAAESRIQELKDSIAKQNSTSESRIDALKSELQELRTQTRGKQ